MAKVELEQKKCTTPEFRVSYPYVFHPREADEGQEPKYGISMLFNKKTDLKVLKAAADNAATEKWGPKEKWPKGLTWPFRDGDEKSDTPGYENTILVNASTKTKPQVVDQTRTRIYDEEEFYAGCYARATLIAFAYEHKGKKGVSFALLNLQKLRDGERFGGRKNAEDEFSAVEVESSDSDNADMGF